LSVASAACTQGTCLPRDLGQRFEGWIGGYPPNFFTWSADGTALYVSGLVRMTQLLYAIDVATEEARALTPGREAYWSFSISRDGRTVAFLASNSASAGDVAVSPLDHFAPRRLTLINPGLPGFRLGSPEAVRWTSRDGLEIEGLLLKPSNYQVGRRYPLLVQMEGTYGTFDLSFSGRVAADDNLAFPFQQHVFASAGYAVLMPNPRGAWGYGEEFSKRARGDFGIGPVADILSGVDAMVVRGIADSVRLGIMGTGYDSYRTIFALTQTDRFKAASVDNPLYDLIKLYGAGAGSILDVLVGGSPTTKPDEYARISPANFPERLRVPTLISYNDDGGSLQQGAALEAALRKNGTPVDVILYHPTPGERAWGPKALATLVRRNLEWFERWVAVP
jgi:dipeptidyl aminopeptidase/acylaminoacyl peptidase